MTTEMLKRAISTEFCDADFDPEGLGLTRDMVNAAEIKFGAPSEYPRHGEHPRVLFTKQEIPGIKAALNSEECKTAADAFWSMANAEVDGKLPPPCDKAVKRGNHNYDYSALTSVQSKALAYVITEDEKYGFEAIYALMNFIKTLEVNWMYIDLYREYGFVMYTAACVYDWCYPLLTEEDKRRISLGIEHRICRGYALQPELCSFKGVKMEMGFPPTKQGAVADHGCEQSLLRDYLSFSIAVYDELPDWYEFIGGRFYNQYIEPRNIFYESSYYPQGTSYNTARFHFDLYSACLIEAATGKNPYSKKLHSVVYGLYSHVTNAKSADYFKVGDVRTSTVRINQTLGYCALIASHLYSDETLRAIASMFPVGFERFDPSPSTTSAAEFFIWSSRCRTVASDPVSAMPLVQYYGGFVGQYIARNSWGDDSAVVLMKVQERTTANHDHAAAGNFQIYYKGILTGDTGDYGGTVYGSDHCKYFLRATISHNGILVYNPAFAETQDGYYTGGQRIGLKGLTTLDSWRNEIYSTGRVTSHECICDNEGKPELVHIAGDITAAYDKETVDFVSRSMITLFKDDKRKPMVTFVFDRVEAKNESFKKTFLLQIPGHAEPLINESEKSVTVTNGGGKLKLMSLLGADSIVGIGGTAEDGSRLNYQIGGKQISFVELGKLKDGITWGRVEISAAPGNKVDNFLSVISVSDADVELTEKAGLIKCEAACGKNAPIGAELDGVAVLFANGREKLSDSFSFTTDAKSEYTFIICGLADGEWCVSRDGRVLAEATLEGDRGIIRFTSNGGHVSVTRK